MSYRAVKCPNCGEMLRTIGKVFFRHCGIAFLVESCLIADVEAKMYFSKPKKSTKGNYQPFGAGTRKETDKERDVNAGQNPAELRREGAQELGESANPDNSEPVSGRADSPSEGSAETGAETGQLILKKPSEGDHA